MNNQQCLKSQQQDALRPKVRQMSDQEVTQRYGRELLKLKTLNQFGRHSEPFLGYPNTLVMNLCRRELERQGLPVPPVNPLEATERGKQDA
jgi:hypothetical protein